MRYKDQDLDKLKKWIKEGIPDSRVTGLGGTARAFFLAGLLMDLDRASLIVLPQAKEVNRFYRELGFFLSESHDPSAPDERRLFDFPIYDISPLAGLSPHGDVVSRRLEALYRLTAGKNPIGSGTVYRHTGHAGIGADTALEYDLYPFNHHRQSGNRGSEERFAESYRPIHVAARF